MIEGCGAVGVEEKLATALAECKEAKREEKARYEVSGLAKSGHCVSQTQ